MQANSQCHNYSSFIRPFESGNCGKKGKKLQKNDYLKNENSFLDEIESIFLCFEILSLGKIGKIYKIGHKL